MCLVRLERAARCPAAFRKHIGDAWRLRFEMFVGARERVPDLGVHIGSPQGTGHAAVRVEVGAGVRQADTAFEPSVRRRAIAGAFARLCRRAEDESSQQIMPFR